MSCFCGCGRDVKGVRLKAANALGDQMRPLLASFEGALDAGVLGDDRAEVDALATEVRPDGGPPFEVARKMTVSRLALPRIGDEVEVSYDPQDTNGFVYRLAAASPVADGPATDDGDRLDRLRQLGELRDAKVLSDEEFEAEKQRIIVTD